MQGFLEKPILVGPGRVAPRAVKVAGRTSMHLRATVVVAVETTPRCRLRALDMASSVTPGTPCVCGILPPGGFPHLLTTHHYPTTIIFHGLIILFMREFTLKTEKPVSLYIRAVIHKHNTFVLSRLITEKRETSVATYTRCDSQTQ